ncbi:YjcZ family sporulation protein [Paenibacillus sp. HW567]|nr:YjcZ family sporulation protein [Paenibacillus sp. HW567]
MSNPCCNPFTSTGTILVLFILLVIITRTFI